MSLTINFVGTNTTSNELGASVKHIALHFKEENAVIVTQGEKETVAGELKQALVTFNDGTVKRFDIKIGYNFKEHVCSTIKFSVAQTTISIVSDAGVGGELNLVV